MSDYKTAKEAFVADNLGSSIFNILTISSTALTSYALYSIVVARYHSHPLLDYATTVLPLLISITISATSPLIFNFFLLLVITVLKLSEPTASEAGHINGHGPLGPAIKSPGSWLDESDSDEEPMESPQPPAHTLSSPLRLSSDDSRPSSTFSLSPTSPSPSQLSVDGGSNGPSQRTWKRRHSPTPSSHTHTAIDILATPDGPSSPSMDNPNRSYPSPVEARFQGQKSARKKLPFLSVYRAHMMIMTVHSILAVDFQVFPRWLGKCENFGTSLMDVGVGSFVFSLGLVSARSFSQSPSISQGNSTIHLINSLLTSLRKSAPVLALGIIRVIMVKGSDYPEHVTEYGVHWNFFFTLGILPVFGTLLAPIRQRWMRWSVMGLVISVIHQYSLLNLGLQDWVMSDIRIGWLGMNKEGLVSLAGYIAIYLLGLSTGGHLVRASEPSTSTTISQLNLVDPQKVEEHYNKRRTELALVLFSYSAAWWTGLSITQFLGIQVSRRLANLPYVLWTVGYNTTFLLGYLILEIILFKHPENAVPPLLEAINSNGLAVFLLANLLTGLINLSIKTMYTPSTISLPILLGYSITICQIAWTTRNIQLKL